MLPIHVRKLALRRFMVHDGTDLELPDSGIVLVSGLNGSGKTTLLRALVHEIDEDDVIVTVETDYDAAFADAGLKRADEVEFYAGKGNAATALVDAQARRGRVQCSRLSQLLGMPLVGDYFGREGFGGDWYIGPTMQRSSGGGFMPLG